MNSLFNTIHCVVQDPLWVDGMFCLHNDEVFRGMAQNEVTGCNLEASQVVITTGVDGNFTCLL